jgi:hypothetical protein
MIINFIESPHHLGQEDSAQMGFLFNEEKNL